MAANKVQTGLIQLIYSHLDMKARGAGR